MKTRNGGYTILEALLFLAISGLLFALVLPPFIGRENKQKFSESVRDMESKMSDVINDVSTGYYPNTATKCYVRPGSPAGDKIIFPPAAGPGSPNNQQGARQECMFLGKSIRINSADPSIDIITVVGRSEDIDTGTTPNNLITATPTAVAPSGGGGGLTNITEVYETKWRVPITRLVIIDSASGGVVANTGAFGIMLQLGSNKITSDTKSLDFFNIDDTDPTMSQSAVVDEINDNGWNPKRNFVICMQSPSDNNRRAAIRAGVNDNPTVISLFDDRIVEEFGVDICA